MPTLIIGLIAAIALYIALGFQRREETVFDAKGNPKSVRGRDREWKTRPAQALALIVLAGFVLLSSVTVVPTGYTGVLTTFGRVENRTISAGAHFILPWQSVVKMDNRTQKVQIATEAFSSDIQQVNVQLSVNYCIDQSTAQELYRTVGINYYDSVMLPRILENTKAVFSQYTAENLIAKRNMLSDLIAESTSADMKAYGITIVSIAIEDIDFTDAFTTAVEAKQVAAQNKLTAETEQAQKTMEEEATARRAIIAANAEAEKAVIAANAELEVVKVQAEAALYAGEKEAEMNKRISESLTQALIQYYWIKQWNGELPDTVLGSDASYMIDLRDQP
ncbi:MAG: prohibitin family protein [Oscillospiraceae bacterium]|nr:prohibitin family protein [Oscillospiraceae bacterium]